MKGGSGSDGSGGPKKSYGQPVLHVSALACNLRSRNENPSAGPRERPVSYSLAATLVMLPALAVRGAAQSSQEPVALGDFIVTATRTPVRPSALGSSVDLISGDDLARQQVSSLQEALGGAAGMRCSRAARPALRLALYARCDSDQTCFWWTACDERSQHRLLGILGWCSGVAFDTIEIARGPQSTLYGGEAIGGWWRCERLR